MRNVSIPVVIFLTMLSIICAASKDYSNHKLIRVTARNEDDLREMRKLLSEDSDKFDVWNVPQEVGDDMHILIAPDVARSWISRLQDEGLEVRLLDTNLQWAIEEEQTHIDLAKVSVTDDMSLFPIDKYHIYEEILDYMGYLHKTYKNHVTLVEIGKTALGNPIRGLRIGAKSMNRKPAVWIDAGIHARERITVAVAVYYMKLLATHYHHNASVTLLLDTYDFYIFPVLNPDGYNYTFTTDRLYRKNRSLKATKCQGVDLNRNYGNVTSDDEKECETATFAGYTPFSELETQAVRDGVLKLRKALKAFFTFHSFGQLWMTPMASTHVAPRDFQDHKDALEAAKKAMKRVGSATYHYGPIRKYFSAITGACVDWVYSVAKIKYAFAVEVRNKFSFILPTSEIVPTANENFAAIEAILLKIRDELTKTKSKSKSKS